MMMTTAQVISGMVGMILQGCHVSDNWQFALFMGGYLLMLYAVKALQKLTVTSPRFMTVK